jgi:hypothetical protein
VAISHECGDVLVRDKVDLTSSAFCMLSLSKGTSISHPQLDFTSNQFYSKFEIYVGNRTYNGCFFKFGVEVGVELSIVNAIYKLRITDQLFKSYAFTRVVLSQSTLQRLLRRQI